jgi:hypothetical protein
MINTLQKHPVLLAALVISLLITQPAFFSTMSFIQAVTPEQARTDGKPLPSGWSAGVMNHGSYYQWWTIQENPLVFGISVLCLVTSVLFVWGTVLRVWWLYRKNG